MSNVYGSETYCAELNQKGWNRIDFDDSEWKNAVVVTEQDAPKGELIEQFQPAIKVICSYSAKYVHTVSGRDIYDLGQHVSGMLKLSYRGKKGDVIYIYPAEKLNEAGNVDQVAKNWVTVGNCTHVLLEKMIHGRTIVCDSLILQEDILL